jgi:hypothetical protein
MLSNQDLVYAWATAYHQAGWCVLPAKNKHPITKWRDHQRSRPLLHEVQDMFNTPNLQIALITGKISNLTVVDIDTHKEGCAIKRDDPCDCNPIPVSQLAERLPSTLTSVTGSGGLHLFYQYDPSIPNSVNLAHPQLDIRSEGGVIILPPSLHYSGNEYTWKKELPWSKEAIASLPPFPPALKKLLKDKPKNNWSQLVKGLHEGARNKSAAALTGKLLLTFSSDGRQGLEAAYELLKLWNQHKNNPPLPEAELLRTFKSVASKDLMRLNLEKQKHNR